MVWSGSVGWGQVWFGKGFKITIKRNENLR